MMKKHPPKIPVDKNSLPHTSADQKPLTARLPGVEMCLMWAQSPNISNVDHQAFLIYVP